MYFRLSFLPPFWRKCLLMMLFVVLSGCQSTQPTQSFYEEIGGKKGIAQFMKIAVNRFYDDPEIGHFFRGVPKRHIHRQLTNQLCELVGGPCQYTGKDMQESHAEMGVTEKDFYILVEHLQLAIRESGLTYAQENQILKYLAPMKADIVQ